VVVLVEVLQVLLEAEAEAKAKAEVEQVLGEVVLMTTGVVEVEDVEEILLRVAELHLQIQIPVELQVNLRVERKHSPMRTVGVLYQKEVERSGNSSRSKRANKQGI